MAGSSSGSALQTSLEVRITELSALSTWTTPSFDSLAPGASCAGEVRRLRTTDSVRSSMPDPKRVRSPGRSPVRLDERDLAGGEVIHAAGDVDLLAGVELLDDRRRVLEPGRLPPHVLSDRVVEQVAGLRLLRDDHGRLDRGDELGQMAWKDGL